ncbi:hypothetical protein [Streptomyces malaysiensis]|nr:MULTISPECIES: hypothetical protein [Streptomyces]
MTIRTACAVAVGMAACAVSVRTAVGDRPGGVHPLRDTPKLK